MQDDFDNPSEAVDRAVEALRGISVPDGPSPATVARTLEAVRAADNQQSSILVERITNMPWTSKAAALFSMAACGLVLYALFADPFGGSVAFADVAQKLREAKTLTYLTTTEVEGQPGSPMTFKSYFKEPFRMRTELPGGVISISDTQQRKSLTLQPEQKTAMLLEYDIQADPKGNANPAQDRASVIENLRNLVNQEGKPLGEREIDGVAAKGFEVTADGQTMKVWADRKTGDPIRIEIPAEILGKTATVVLTELEFNVPLDEELFSLDVPEGYKLQKLPRLNVTTELDKAMVEFLGGYAKLSGGAYPADLQDWAGIFKETFKDKNATEPNPDVMQVMQHAGIVTALLSQYKRHEQYDYIADVKPGDADSIVFWYRPAKSEKYRAVYGDLRIADVAKADLPPPSKPVKDATSTEPGSKK